MRNDASIALVTMPLFDVIRPSIQIGSLKSLLLQHQVTADDYYLNADFANIVGVGFYRALTKCLNINIGDWLFSPYSSQAQNTQYLRMNRKFIMGQFNSLQPGKNSWEQISKKLLYIKRSRINKWLQYVNETIEWNNYQIVGFTCVFSQFLASLALAKLIKSRHPNIVIVFGGSFFDGDAGREVSKQFHSVVDCVVQGEGEDSILKIVDLVKNNKGIPKILQSPTSVDLDKLPLPDYDAYYFHVLKSLQKDVSNDFGVVPLETSRGCWWGAKKRCNFCGLIGTRITYRQKSAKVFLNQVHQLSRKYGCYDFNMVDNIMPWHFFNTALPQLKKLDYGYRFSYEIKANLRVAQIKLLREAGVQWLQPGIETLSTNLLRKLGKGNTLLHNLTMLKWCAYYKIDVAWNLLTYIPGETLQDYQDMLELIPKIAHLQPPACRQDIRLDRFSPYFINTVEKKMPSFVKHFMQASPDGNLPLIYPDNWDIYKLAVFYNFQKNTRIPKAVIAQLDRLLTKWQKNWLSEKPTLFLKKAQKQGHIIDRRQGCDVLCEIDGAQYEIAKIIEYESLTCKEIASLAKLSNTSVIRCLADLVAHDLVVIVDKRYFWLPFPMEK